MIMVIFYFKNILFLSYTKAPLRIFLFKKMQYIHQEYLFYPKAEVFPSLLVLDERCAHFEILL